MMTNRSTLWKHVVSEKLSRFFQVECHRRLKPGLQRPCDNSLGHTWRCTASVVQKKRGLTLLEVVVGLVLMGSLLVSSLLAFSRHRRQLRLADKRIEAAVIADDIVNGLLNQKEGVPVNSRGAIPGHPNWFWQTSSVGITQIASIDLQVIRFEIFELGESTVRLVTVELAKQVAAVASATNEKSVRGELFLIVVDRSASPTWVCEANRGRMRWTDRAIHDIGEVTT